VRVVSRVSIRLRLALVFTLAMALVLAATGIFVYVRLQAALDQTLNAGLRSRADVVAALVRQSDTGLSEGSDIRLAERGESYAQVIDGSGNVIDTTPQLGGRPLLTASELARAKRGTLLFERGASGELDSKSRILATPVVAQGQSLVVVVGASLEPRDAALNRLLTQLLLGGPLALTLASLIGYGLAAAALRPVESMRAQAAEISGSDLGARLPISPADDEIRRLGETLNEMLGRLEQAIRRERTFVADASHELRTPLALLKTELELALRRTRSVDEMRDAIESAAEETDRLNQLAEDLLVLARADDGRVPLRLEPVNATDVLDVVAARFASRGELAGRRIAVEPSPLALEADRVRLEQALGNLVDNALRHGDGNLRLFSHCAGGQVEFHVEDHGPGFPPAYLPRAFDRFTRGSDARERGGTGLGLAIVAVVARAHGGSAHAINRPCGGADVWLSLPGSLVRRRDREQRVAQLGDALR
jgi:two-component system OmpR family sensor kinase